MRESRQAQKAGLFVGVIRVMMRTGLIARCVGHLIMRMAGMMIVVRYSCTLLARDSMQIRFMIAGRHRKREQHYRDRHRKDDDQSRYSVFETKHHQKN